MMLTRRCFVMGLGVVAMLAVAMAPGTAEAQKRSIFTSDKIAVRGTDVVAYFTEGRPRAGSAAHAASYKGSMFHFASKANRDLFKAAPAKYAPQFGGYCAYAVANGYTAPTVPEAWAIVDGKLYLNYSVGVRARWNKDRAGYISRGNANWPKVLGK